LQPSRVSNLIRIAAWSLAGLIVLLVLTFAVTAVTLPGCTQCHRSAPFVAQTAQSVHANVSCVRCHVQSDPASRVAYAYHLIFGMALRVAPVGTGPVAGIPNQTCLSCHADVMTKVVTANGVSIEHSNCAKGSLCTDCHSDTAHGTAVKWVTKSDMNRCLDCHASKTVRANCTTCHATRSVQERVTTGEWTVTHGPNWKQTHGMGDLKTCAACHADDFCVTCHGLSLPHNADFLRMHPGVALTQRKDCEVCHKQTFCDDCHGLPMPHPASFTPTHATLVQKQGQTVCLRCHVQDDCTNCHVKHVHPGGASSPPVSGAK